MFRTPKHSKTVGQNVRSRISHLVPRFWNVNEVPFCSTSGLGDLPDFLRIFQTPKDVWIGGWKEPFVQKHREVPEPGQLIQSQSNTAALPRSFLYNFAPTFLKSARHGLLLVKMVACSWVLYRRKVDDREPYLAALMGRPWRFLAKLAFDADERNVFRQGGPLMACYRHFKTLRETNPFHTTMLVFFGSSITHRSLNGHPTWLTFESISHIIRLCVFLKTRRANRGFISNGGGVRWGTFASTLIASVQLSHFLLCLDLSNDHNTLSKIARKGGGEAYRIINLYDGFPSLSVWITGFQEWSPGSHSLLSGLQAHIFYGASTFLLRLKELVGITG